ncbi:MAG TPA: hypothetical protein VKA18_01565, partial [Alphaproteobacteria bacterium]|nr:hypothetical protein [Alphaproteobacteria bacterium]
MNRTSRWRRAQRQRLRLTRETLPLAWRQDADEVIAGRLVKHVPELRQQRFAFYWPMPGEPDLRAAAA